MTWHKLELGNVDEMSTGRHLSRFYVLFFILENNTVQQERKLLPYDISSGGDALNVMKN